MRDVTVRTPQSDRVRIQLAEGAQDLLKTPYAISSGENDSAPNTDLVQLSQANLLEAVGFTLTSAGLLLCAIGGLYRFGVTVDWNWDNPGSIQRQIGIAVNDVTKGIVLRGTVADGQDFFTALIRLEAGDTIRPYVLQTDGGDNTEVVASTLELSLVAP